MPENNARPTDSGETGDDNILTLSRQLRVIYKRTPIENEKFASALGHSEIKTMEIYTHVKDNLLRKQLEQPGGKIRAITPPMKK